jgi:hypothetical protein
MPVHSLRKYFKTQLLSLGVQPDYVDYMMGHIVDTYRDIQMKGTELLRHIYASSGLSIRPKIKISKVEALTEPHRTVIYTQDQEGSQLQILSKTFRDLIRRETAVQIRSVGGGPAGN